MNYLEDLCPCSNQADFISGFKSRYLSTNSSGTLLKGQEKLTHLVQMRVNKKVKLKITPRTETPSNTRRVMKIVCSLGKFEAILIILGTCPTRGIVPNNTKPMMSSVLSNKFIGSG